MSLSHGPATLAIPGPSIIPDRVLRAMHRPAPNIYAGALIEMTHTIVPDLKAVARTRHHAVMYVGNGHAAWEACLANTHSRGDLVLVPATGLFGNGWAAIARGLGLEVEVMDFGKRTPMDPDRIAERLAADTQHRIKSVLAVHVDTSTSIRNDIPAIRAALDEAGHPALLQADCIASMGCDVFEMDEWGVNVAITGCQKGLMTPPGMSFVFYDDRAAAARAGADCVTAYWDWTPRTDPDRFYQYFAGTAPTHHLHGLRTALDMLVHEEGVEAAWHRHGRLARALWAAFEAWAHPDGIGMNVVDRAHRSHAVTALRLDGAATRLREWCTDEMGVTLGIGLGMADYDDPRWHDFFRLGHMGHLSGHSLMGTLGAIQTGLTALGIPHGPGALDAAASALAAEG
ncbi:pyridoxal-phosphate-dependent aminotransferase family protein [Jannaschia sp. LMIT008]|uniref:pyridoxal-phosphate-dependent aminotransferase family protein n=1 Tax=Jannaschia maritima TaxID=3032585 RepID=UPI0028118D07|nr:aminotransferase class V-fold PLP-dependent enzyme [Jannaschia sp. LMIT008]